MQRHRHAVGGQGLLLLGQPLRLIAEEPCRGARQLDSRLPASCRSILQLIQTSQAQTNQRIDDLGRTVANSQLETNRRIDDLSTAVTNRLDGMDERLQRVEANERSTAIKAGAVGAVSSAVMTGGMELLKHFVGVGG